MNQPALPVPPPWPEPWAVQVSVEADRIEHRMRTATAGALTGSAAASKAAVERHLTRARTLYEYREGMVDSPANARRAILDYVSSLTGAQLLTLSRTLAGSGERGISNAFFIF